MAAKKKASSSKKKSTKQSASAHLHEENLIGMLAHLLGLFFGFIGPLVLFLIKNDDKNGIARENARHALNFQLSLMIYFVISTILMIVVIGFFTFFGIWIFAIIAQIVASIRAYEGKVFEYPLEIVFIK